MRGLRRIATSCGTWVRRILKIVRNLRIGEKVDRYHVVLWPDDALVGPKVIHGRS
jgi:hypothetical protein